MLQAVVSFVECRIPICPYFRHGARCSFVESTHRRGEFNVHLQHVRKFKAIGRRRMCMACHASESQLTFSHCELHGDESKASSVCRILNRRSLVCSERLYGDDSAKRANPRISFTSSSEHFVHGGSPCMPRMYSPLLIIRSKAEARSCISLLICKSGFASEPEGDVADIGAISSPEPYRSDLMLPDNKLAVIEVSKT